MGATRFNETTLSLAVSASRSLRTTVVAFAADKMKLKDGDTVGWRVEGRAVRLDKGRGEHVSKVVRAQSSYRTTVPRRVVDALRVSRKDVLVWDVDKECGGRWYAVIRKKRQA